MAPEQGDVVRPIRARVARFGKAEQDGSGGAAPVARFGEAASDEPDGTVTHALLDRLGEQAAGPVAELGEPGGPAETAPVAGLAGIGVEPGSHPAAIADLAGGGRSRAKRVRPTRGDRPRGPRADVAQAADAEQRADAARTAEAKPSASDVAAVEAPGPRERGAAGRDSGAARARGARAGRFGVPQELDPDADPVAVAREICLRLLTDRARTRQELAQALRRKGVPEDAAGAVLERFDEVGLIDDAAFAGQWVRSRHRNKGLARRAIAMELRRKGVGDEVAGEALAEVDAESEETRARELVDRKLRTMPADTPEQRKKAAPRLVGMLARKGYGGGIAYRVVREALAAHGAEIDELGTDPLD
jgi:regulatory protein